jgi:hypothetical protein
VIVQLIRGLQNPLPSPVTNSTGSSLKLKLLDARSAAEHLVLLSRSPPWRQLIADLVVRHCPRPRPPLSICLLPDHPLVIITANLLHAGLSIRAVILLDRIAQGAGSLSKPLSCLYLSPEALETLVDTALDLKAANILPSLTRELARTHSTGASILAFRLSNVYAKLMNAHFMMDDPGSALSIYSTATRASVPCNAFMHKRAIQSLFKRFIPSPDSDVRRASQPRQHNLERELHTPPSSKSHPPVDAILDQLRMILSRMAAENIIPSSRILADIFRGLGSILKLETQGTEPEHPKLPRDTVEQEGFSSTPKTLPPRFRLDRLVLHQETWSSVGKIMVGILGQTTRSTISQQPGNEGRILLLMAWADVMLSLREDVADATARTTATKYHLNALSSRIEDLVGANQPWNYQRTFDQLADSSSLRPHHVNSYGAIGSEVDPALDLPVGPAPGEWPISRTLTEAQRISLLIRDRLVEGDSLAALLHFHSLASLCGAFRRLCDINDPEDAPSLLARTPRGGASQRPPEAVLAEARHELDVRVESVYVRLAGHALRTGDSSYVNDVLELAYTLPPRRNKYTFSRVWKRAMGAFVSWRSEWHGSAGIGRAFRTLAQLLEVRSETSTTRESSPGTIEQAKLKAPIAVGPNRELFDLSWLRERHTWPALGRNVFPRPHVVSALINRAEQSTPSHLRPGAKPDRAMAAKHLRDAQRAAEEAQARRAIRWLQENHPRYMPRPGDPSPSLAELDARARAEAQPSSGCGWNSDPVRASGSGNGMQTGLVGDGSVGIPATTLLVDVLGALNIPVTTDEAQRLGYPGPTYTKKPPQESAPTQGIER